MSSPCKEVMPRPQVEVGTHAEKAHLNKIVGAIADLYKSQSVPLSTHTPQRKSEHNSTCHVASLQFSFLESRFNELSSMSSSPSESTCGFTLLEIVRLRARVASAKDFFFGGRPSPPPPRLRVWVT